MVGFGEVGEFEIDGEGLGDAISVFDRQAADNFAGAGHLNGGCIRRPLASRNRGKRLRIRPGYPE